MVKEFFFSFLSNRDGDYKIRAWIWWNRLPSVFRDVSRCIQFRLPKCFTCKLLIISALLNSEKFALRSCECAATINARVQSCVHSSNRNEVATLAEFPIGTSRRRQLTALLRAKAYYGLKWHENGAFYAPYGTTRCYRPRGTYSSPSGLWAPNGGSRAR